MPCAGGELWQGAQVPQRDLGLELVLEAVLRLP